MVYKRMALLQVNNISKRFGGLQAVKDVSFSVREGSIKAVIGPNGAGKTTLFNLLSGFLLPDSGAIVYKGRPIHAKSPHEIAQQGLSRTFQHIRLFAHMTALENVMVGRHVRSRAGFLAGMLNLPWTWREEQEIREKALALMEFLGIVDLADANATSLSYGEKIADDAPRAVQGNPEVVRVYLGEDDA